MQSLSERGLSCSLALLLTVIGGAANAAEIDGLNVRVGFDSNESTVRVVAKNVGRGSVEIYDSLSPKLTVPYFLSYSLRDVQHGAITKTDQHSDGFLSSNMFRSSLLESPEKRRLIEIQPQAEVSRKVNLTDLLGGTRKYWAAPSSEIDVAYIKFKIRIYADRDFSKYIDVESDEYPVSGTYLVSH
jgi:hypothetical protein